MINAKDKFREGYIRLKRPFEFAELDEPLQELTVLYAYAEKPVFTKVLTDQARQVIDQISRKPYWGSLVDKQNYIDQQVEIVLGMDGSHKEEYEGEIVQCYVGKTLCRFYPDEYSILSEEALQVLYDEEGYHVMVNNDALYSLPSVKDRMFYCQSRGIDKNTALRWAVKGMKELVYFKPYFQLLELFARNIFTPDPFYERVEGLKFTN